MCISNQSLVLTHMLYLCYLEAKGLYLRAVFFPLAIDIEVENIKEDNRLYELQVKWKVSPIFFHTAQTVDFNKYQHLSSVLNTEIETKQFICSVWSLLLCVLFFFSSMALLTCNTV